MIAYACPNVDCRCMGTNMALTSPRYVKQVNDEKYNCAKKGNKPRHGLNEHERILGPRIQSTLQNYRFLAQNTPYISNT